MKVIFWPFLLDLVGADMLGDAAGLAGDDIGLADRVEQRRLAVVDVAHDGDHRRPRHQILDRVGGGEQARLDVGLGDARTVWPISSAMIWAVSASITSATLTSWPCFISSLITSTARSAMRLASSWMVIVSGMITSRDDLLARPFMGAGAVALAAAADRGERAGALGIVERVDQRSACRGGVPRRA